MNDAKKKILFWTLIGLWVVPQIDKRIMVLLDRKRNGSNVDSQAGHLRNARSR